MTARLGAPQDKMRGRIKTFGRCHVEGHGSWCVLSREIQESSIDRAAEKRAWQAEVTKYLAAPAAPPDSAPSQSDDGASPDPEEGQEDG